LGAYIKKGADRLLQQREEQFGYGSYRLLVVTDGEASDPTVMERHVPEVLARGIIVDVIGVNMKTDHTLATKVHTYRRADDPAALKTAIAEVFAEVSDSGSNATDEEAFELIAALPDETSGAMLQALATSGNHPIGEDPPGRDLQAERPPTPPPAGVQPGNGLKSPAHGAARKEPFQFNKLLVYAIVVFVLVWYFGLRQMRKRS